ncbi:MAG: hypothetical protein HY730_02220 [Candidatus Tectomicrobia bacterium]|uniref:Uncharacterized protein n=1 Tax=Tectimicrobiota bacterium TaxID=2528274 RepID=A0A933GLW5_UNCTE|nr:hypothetical protein [Candidatus Tectomicrobia bacterium]
MYELQVLGLSCLIAPIFAKYSGYEIQKKPFDLVGVTGLFFLLSAAFTIVFSEFEMLKTFTMWAAGISRFLGWIGLFVGAIWAACNVITEREAHVTK